MVRNRKSQLFFAAALGFLAILVYGVGTVQAAPRHETWVGLFGDDILGENLCTREMTLRYPERCSAFSPGAREVRMAYLRAHLPDPLPALPVEELEVPEGAVTPYTFAYVRTLPAPTYTHPAEAEAGLAPKRTFAAGDNWVSVMNRTEYNGQVWYEINNEEFIQADYLGFANPSRFHGVMLNEQPQYPFAWINRAVNASPLPGAAAGSTAFSRYQLVTLFGEETVGERLWYMIGPDQWVEQAMVSRVDVDPRPEGVGAEEKWLEVDTFEQTIAAYEGDRMVFATLISSGRHPNWTPNGLTRIWGKLPSTPMSNQDSTPESLDWYYLEDVEWTQYFNGAYALHTAYWHDAFSFTRSHGCINLAPLDAKWLFDWTTPVLPEGAKVTYSHEGEGTWVWVHMSEPIPGLVISR